MDKHFILGVICLCLFYNVNSQNQPNLIDSLLVTFREFNFEASTPLLKKIDDSFYNSLYTIRVEDYKTKNIEDTLFNTFSELDRNDSYKEILFLLTEGDFFYLKRAFDKAIAAYETAYNLSVKINANILSCDALRRLCSHYLNTQINTNELKESVDRYQYVAFDAFEKYYYYFFSLTHLMQINEKRPKNVPSINFKKLIKKAKKLENHISLGEAYQLNGVYYLLFNKNSDSTIYYYALAKEQFTKFGSSKFLELKKEGVNLNLIQNLIYDGDFKASLRKNLEYTEAKSSSGNLRIDLSRNQFLKESYYALKDYEKAYHYLTIENKIRDSLDIIKVIDINTKFKTERKEKENLILKNQNLELESKRKQNRNLLVGSLAVLLFTGLTFFLIQKSTKRKHKLVKQEKELETQKLSNVLKEQELKAIDAMIEGQEKERQRIANDLHDDLGGLMATVKLHFNALKNKNSPELFEKTDHLIEEAYQKVRTVAHAKNSGVIAKQGLLKAVKHMADKISLSSNITIDVIHYGLENRLENSLELTLFRIIQELTTNVIKHANSTEATIHLTNHENTINIMVEDNGIGFNPKQITKTKPGMGINSIDKRVEHLDGKLTIESDKNQGTTVIIDIPI